MTRLAFFGTPAVAASTLASLLEAGHEVGIVISNPDRRRSRGAQPMPSAVKAFAESHHLRVSDQPRDVLSANCELGVVVAYGHLIKREVLDHLMLVNVHFSLLPRWRGAAPVERAIFAGDEVTGVCLMRLEEGLDTGPVYARAATTIGRDEQAEALRARLGEMGVQLLLDELSRGDDAFGEAGPQSGEPTYAHKLQPEDRHLDFSKSAVSVSRQVRVGRAWTTFREKRMLIHRATVVGLSVEQQSMLKDAAPGEIIGDLVSTADGALRLMEVQAEGRSRMEATAWAIGAKVQPGERFV